jgi:CRP-like cAMP-binding protein
VSVLSTGQARILAPQKPSGDPLVVTAFGATARYLAVDEAAIAKVRAAAPWVADELSTGCDAIHALSGVLAGRFGGSLSEPLFAELRKQCEARRLPAGALVMKEGEPVRGLMMLAAGRLDTSPSQDEISCGEVIFVDELLAGKNAPSTVRAGRDGALLLVARRAQTKALLAQPELAKLLRS